MSSIKNNDAERNIHIGHRKRVKEEFLANGFNKNPPPHKVLEYLLFYALQQGDTNPLAHDLIKRYKTIAGVLDAPVEELITFKGITVSNVGLLKVILPIARIYANDKKSLNNSFADINEIGDYLLPKYIGFTEEALGILSLDGNVCELGFNIVEQGDLSSVGVSTRKIIEEVIRTKANGIVMAHNHPSGIALPSAADITMTETVADALSHVGVRLIDHLIIANGDFVSMAQTKRYSYIFYK